MQGERVNFTQEITVSEEMTPVPYVIFKVSAFTIVFSLKDMCTTHPPIQLLTKETLKILFHQATQPAETVADCFLYLSLRGVFSLF